MSQGDGLWSVPLVPDITCEQRALCALRKRVIELQGVV